MDLQETSWHKALKLFWDRTVARSQKGRNGPLEKELFEYDSD